MKACEMLPLNEYEHSKSRTSLAFDSCEQQLQQQQHHHQHSDHINGGRVRRITSYGAGEVGTLRSSDQLYFPSPYALSRVVSVYDGSEVIPHHPVTLSKTASSSPSCSPRHLSSQTPSHSSGRQHSLKQHYDVPSFKQASLCHVLLCAFLNKIPILFLVTSHNHILVESPPSLSLSLFGSLNKMRVIHPVNSSAKSSVNLMPKSISPASLLIKVSRYFSLFLSCFCSPSFLLNFLVSLSLSLSRLLLGCNY